MRQSRLTFVLCAVVAATTGFALEGCGRIGYFTFGDDGSVGADGAVLPNDGAIGNWWDSTWSRGSELRARSGVASELADFPLLVVLNPSRIDYTQVASEGADLRFVDASTGAALAHEIEDWNADGASWIWVKVPRMPADPDVLVLHMYYGNVSATAPLREGEVWTSDFVAVWHMAEDPAAPAAELRDSTALHHGTVVGTTTQLTPGRVGPAWLFADDEDHVTVPMAPTLSTPNAFTFSAWVRPDPAIIGEPRIINNHAQWYVKLTGTGVRRPQVLLFSESAGFNATADYQTGLDSWQHLTVTYAPGDPRWYLDGELVTLWADQPPDGFTMQEPLRDLNIAYYWSGQPRPFSGLLDELRYSGVARTADWVRAHFRSLNDQILDYRGVQSRP